MLYEVQQYNNMYPPPARLKWLLFDTCLEEVELVELYEDAYGLLV